MSLSFRVLVFRISLWFSQSQTLPPSQLARRLRRFGFNPQLAIPNKPVISRMGHRHPHPHPRSAAVFRLFRLFRLFAIIHPVTPAVYRASAASRPPCVWPPPVADRTAP